ncbi:DUF7344 domain-containing protein [Halostella litorea]|uniref:DUF7344 domain-containing protein n=1 Tax=Halostella litorea TaxID=2528831 RepID=UPI00192A4AEC|nr:hypothetical protein [Halostella litorea]
MRIARAERWEEANDDSQDGTTDGQEHEVAVAESAARDAVSDPDRRYLLEYLLLNRYMVSRADVAAEVAARRGDGIREAVDDRRRKRVEVRLRHNHLPKLADAGLLEYDPTSTMVALSPDAEDAVRAAL